MGIAFQMGQILWDFISQVRYGTYEFARDIIIINIYDFTLKSINKCRCLSDDKVFLKIEIVFVKHYAPNYMLASKGFVCLFVLKFYRPVNPMGSYWARSVYLTTVYWAG